MKNFYDKGFRLASIEYTPSGYGLRVMTFVARDGEAWRVRGRDGCIPVIGADIRVRLVGTRNTRDWSSLKFELPEPLPRMPKQVVRALYR